MKEITCPHCKQKTTTENCSTIQMEQLFICSCCGRDITKEIEWFNFNNKDMLTDIYEQQFELQKKLGTINKINESPQMRQQYINQMILGVYEEANEILRETAYKNPEFVPFGWKKNQKENTELFKEELVDLLHFFMNLCIVAKMKPDEIYSKYTGKNKENIKRKDNNY